MSQLGRKIDIFSPLEACIASSDTVKGSPLTGVFHVSTSLIPPCLVPSVCEVISNKTLPPSYSRQPEMIAIPSIVWAKHHFYIYIICLRHFVKVMAILIKHCCSMAFAISTAMKSLEDEHVLADIKTN